MSETCFESTHPILHLTKPWWHERRSWDWVYDVSKTNHGEMFPKQKGRDVFKTKSGWCFQNKKKSEFVGEMFPKQIVGVVSKKN